LKIIPFHQIPGMPPLVVDMLDGNAGIEPGFSLTVDAATWRERSAKEASLGRTSKLTEHILSRAKGLDLHESARRNIEALSEPGTLTVVTGQQVGLAGGPLLTLYKALTTIYLARSLQKESGVRTVPVFWMATSDHNLPEAAQLRWIDKNNKLSGISRPSDDNRSPVGNIMLGDQATELIEKLEIELPDSEFKPEFMEMLRASYRPDETFGRAFHHLGNLILGPLGMVMLDPEDPDLKKSCQPFWERAVGDIEGRMDRLLQRSTEIQSAGYEVQAPVSSGRPALFVLESGIRRKVVLEGRAKRAQSDLIISVSDLMEIAKNEPERFSVGVTLRPLYQGYLLPVGAYVAGPHEVAYWAQLSDVFEPLQIPKPALIHRATMTLLEKKTKRRLSKLNILPEAFFSNLNELTDTILIEHSDNRNAELFLELRRQAGTCSEKLFERASGPYAGLDTIIDNAFKKINYQLDKLENTFNQRLRQQHSQIMDTVEVVSHHLRPAGQLQERVINPFYYYSRYGSRILEILLKKVRHYSEGHIIIDLEEELE